MPKTYKLDICQPHMRDPSALYFKIKYKIQLYSLSSGIVFDEYVFLKMLQFVDSMFLEIHHFFFKLIHELVSLSVLIEDHFHCTEKFKEPD